MVLDGEICALDEDGVPRFQLIQPRINLTARRRPAPGSRPRSRSSSSPSTCSTSTATTSRRCRCSERKQLLRSRAERRRTTCACCTSIEGDGRDVEAGALRRWASRASSASAPTRRYEPGAPQQALAQGEDASRSRSSSSAATRAAKAARRRPSAPWPSATTTTTASCSTPATSAPASTTRTLASWLTSAQGARDRTSRPSRRQVRGQVTWVRPELVAQVKFAEWTKDGRLRAPVFLGLRNDVDPKTVRRERPMDDKQPSKSRGRSPLVRRSRPSRRLSDIGEGPGVRSLRRWCYADVLEQLANPKPNFTVDVEGSDIKLTNLDKEFWPAHGDTRAADQARLHPLLRQGGAVAAAAPQGPAADADALPERHHGQALLPEALRAADPAVRRDGDDLVRAQPRRRRVHPLQQPADAGLAGPARRPRAARLDGACRPGAGRQRPHDGRFGGSEKALDASVLNYPDFMVFDLDPYIYSGARRRAPSRSTTAAAGRRRSRSR